MPSDEPNSSRTSPTEEEEAEAPPPPLRAVGTTVRDSSDNNNNNALAAAAASVPPPVNSNHPARGAPVNGMHAALSRLVRGDTSDVEEREQQPTSAVGATITTTAAVGGGGNRPSATAAAAAAAASNAAAAAARAAASRIRWADRTALLAARRERRTATAATGVVSLDDPNSHNHNNNNNNSNGSNHNAAPQQPHRVVRRLRVPRGARMSIAIGRSPAQHHLPAPPAHLAVPVADLQPEVLREQELLRAADRRSAATATTTTRATTAAAASTATAAAAPPLTATANIKREVMSTAASDLTNGVVVETVHNEDADTLGGGGESMEIDETSTNADGDEQKPAATQDDSSSSSNREGRPRRENSQQPPQPEDDLHHHRYKCSICYDYLDQPVGCGQCSGRFCAACLQQVLQPSSQQPTGTVNNTNHPRCPTCRSPFAAAVLDDALGAEMARISIPCPYAACAREEGGGGITTTGATVRTMMIPLSEYKKHEASCPGVRVACRYAPYGCEWRGYRSELAAHEASDCVLAQIPTLLEQLRTVRAHQSREIHSAQQQTAFLLNSMSAMESTLHGAVMYHRSNPLHLVAFATAATTATVRLLSNRAVWKQMYHSEGARANVVNALALLPTVLLVAKTVAEGIRLHCRAWTWNKAVLLWQSSSLVEPSSLLGGGAAAEAAPVTTNGDAAVASASNEELDVASYLLDHLIMTWHVGLLGVLILLCYYADDSSTTWKTEIQHMLHSLSITPAPRWRSIKLLQCLVYAATFSLYYFIVELRGGCLAVVFAIVSGTVLPCALSQIVNLLATDDSSTANPDPNEDALTFILYKCRATRPLFIGIQCGLNVSAFGLMTCLDACLVSSMILFAARGRVVGGQQGVTPEQLLTFLSFRATVIAVNAFSAPEGEKWLPFLNVFCMSLACALQFLAVSALFYGSLQVGTTLGRAAYARAKRGAASGVLGLRLEHESVFAGVVAFSIWVSSLFFLVVA